MQCCPFRRSFVAIRCITNVNNCKGIYCQIMGSKSRYLICRLCLSYGEVLVDICEGDAEPGFEVKETIEDLLRVEVVPGGDLPWLVCLNCIAKLEDFSNFKFKCISSNSAFIQRFTKPRQLSLTGVRSQAAESAGSHRGGVTVSEPRVCSVDNNRRVVVVALGAGSFTDADTDPGRNGRTVEEYAGSSKVTSCGPSTPSTEENKGNTSSPFKPQHAVAADEGLPSSIKTEDEDPLVPAGSPPLRQLASGGFVIVSTTSTAMSSTEGATKALYFKGSDPREVVQSEMEDDEQDEEDNEDRKDGIFIGRSFDHDANGGGSTATTSCGTSGNTTDNLCPPQPTTRLVVYTGGVEGGGGKRVLSGEEEADSVEQRELRLDKVPPGAMTSSRGLTDPLAVMRETPLERKRRMARERQRRFRARQSSEMAWRRAQDGTPYCKRSWGYEQPTTNSGDEVSAVEKADPETKLVYQLKL